MFQQTSPEPLDDPATSGNGGTRRYMSPELLDPEKFGSKRSRRTKASDCYALGMVIYEVLSGRIPFSGQPDSAAVLKVLDGVRPASERPRGAEGNLFPHSVWWSMVDCWHRYSDCRPTAWDVLKCFERESESWTPPPPLQMGEDSQPADQSTWYSSDLLPRECVGGGVAVLN